MAVAADQVTTALVLVNVAVTPVGVLGGLSSEKLSGLDVDGP